MGKIATEQMVDAFYEAYCNNSQFNDPDWYDLHLGIFGRGFIAGQKDSQSEIESEKIERLQSLIRDLVEDGERLADKAIVHLFWAHNGEPAGYLCRCIDNNPIVESPGLIQHAPDCPIALHIALVERVKQESI